MNTSASTPPCRPAAAWFFLLLLLACGSGCSTLDQVTERGETVRLQVGATEIDAELLLLTDSAAYVIPHSASEELPGLLVGKIYRADFSSFPRFSVEGLVNTDWTGWLLGMQVIPAILVGLEAAGYSKSNDALLVIGALLIPTAVNALILMGGSAIDAIEPYDRQRPQVQREHYRRYAHFPQGLSPEQLRLLLQVHGQEEPFSLAALVQRMPRTK